MSESKYLYIINNVLQGYDRDVVVNHVDELEQQNEQMLEALKLFVVRVEMGEVRSKKTYAQFKEIIESVTGKKIKEIIT